MEFSITPAKRPYDSDASLIPLINIVFLLLIFFMIAGQISNLKEQDIAPPQSVSTTPLVQHSAVFSIDSSGQILFDNQHILLDQLADFVNADQSQITLRADKDLAAWQLDQVLNAFQELGVDSVTLFTRAQDLPIATTAELQEPVL